MVLRGRLELTYLETRARRRIPRCSCHVQTLIRPSKLIGGMRRVCCYVLIAWLLAAASALPLLFVAAQKQQRHFSPNATVIVYECENSAGYTARWQLQAYVTVLTSCFFAIPAGIIIFCYATIMRVMWLTSAPIRHASVQFVACHGNQSKPESHRAPQPVMDRRRSILSCDPPRCNTVPLAWRQRPTKRCRILRITPLYSLNDRSDRTLWWPNMRWIYTSRAATTLSPWMERGGRGMSLAS